MGQITPPRGNLPGVKHGIGILTPRYLKKNIFCHTGQLILSKIIKVVAIGCQILSQKCTKFDFGWGCARDPVGGAYDAPPDR